MIPITVPAAALRSAFAVLSKLISTRTTLPVLQAIRIERMENRILISATDLDRWAVYTHIAEPPPLTELARRLAALRWPKEATTVLVPKSALQSALRAVDAESDVSFELQPRKDGNGESLLIRYLLNGAPVATPVETWSAEEFPAPTQVVSAHAAVLDANARAAIVEARAFASIDETRFVLNGVYLETRWNEEPCPPVVVGTDGRRLHRRTVTALEPLGVNLILPSATVDLLSLPALLAQDWKLFTDSEAKNAQIDAGPWKLASRLVDGNYPNYRQVIPTDHTASATITAGVHGQLLSVLDKLPKPDVKSGKESIRLCFHPDHLDIECPHTRAKVAMPGIACTSRRPKVISLNRYFLRAMLATGPGTLHLTDALSPISYERPRAMHVCMPMRAA